MNAYASSLQAGFAEIDITPVPGDTLNLVGGGTKPVQSIGDRLYVQSAVLSDGRNRVALVSADLIDLRASDFSFIQDELKKQGFDHVVVSVTHTHGGYFSDHLLERVRGKVMQSVEAAASVMRPVNVGAANVEVDESYNRRLVGDGRVEMLWRNPERMPTRPVDRTLGVIHFKTTDGEPYLTMLNYNAHPVITMNLNEPVVSADYPGYLRDSLESELGGRAMFFMGASGDVNPYHANTTPYSDARTKAGEMAAVLSSAARKAVDAMNMFHKDGSIRFDTLYFDEPEAELTLLVLTPDISIAGFPGEYFDELGAWFRENSPTETTFFVGKSNGDLRYVPTKADVKLGGFGADRSSISVKADTGQMHVRRASERLNELAASEPAAEGAMSAP